MDVLFDKFGFSAGVNEVHIMVTNFGEKNERNIIKKLYIKKINYNSI
jgi:hypothetical protein